MPRRRGVPALVLAATLAAGCAAAPPPAPVTISIAQAAPTPEGSAEDDREPSRREVETRSLDGTRWTLHCERKCEIDYFELHAGGKGTYHYHDGAVYDDALWRFEGGVLAISVNDKYATYRARKSGDHFVDGQFENKVGFKFVFTLSRRAGGGGGR